MILKFHFQTSRWSDLECTMLSSVVNVSLSKRSIATQRSLSLSPSFFWDGGGERSGPALRIPQCSVCHNFKVKTCCTRKRFFILFQVTSSYRLVKNWKKHGNTKKYTRVGRCIIKTCICYACDKYFIADCSIAHPKNGAHWSGYKAPDFRLILWYPFFFK